MANLQERVALITGGGTGIGAATARRLAREGWAVAVVGRRPQPLEAVVREIEAMRGRAVAIPADVADPARVTELVEEVVSGLGGLSLLVNNAAVYRPAPAAELELRDWDRHFEVNVRAPFLLCRAAHPHLGRTRGVVVNVLTNLAERPVPGVLAYNCSKAALLSLTRTLALEWARDGIRVVAVSPGVVDTPLHEPERLQAMAPAHPLGRVGRSEEVAAAICFLAGPESEWTTGAVLEVDGGIHLA